MSRFVVVLLFLSVFIFSCKSGQDENQFSDSNLKEIVSSMENELFKFNGEIALLKDHYEYLIANKEKFLREEDRNKYSFDGGFSTNVAEMDSTLSTVYVSTLAPDFKKSMEETYFTNGLDSVFVKLYHQYDLIEQIYTNSAQFVSRVYPSYDAKNLIDEDLDITNFNFYYLGDSKHNPSKGPVWIPEAYVDPAGRGWILSLIHPVYDGDSLFAVLGIDFSIDDIIQRYLDNENGKLLIVNSKGDIVAAKTQAIEALSMPPLKNFVYRETIQMDNFRISDFNLFNSKSKEVRKMAKSILMSKNMDFSFQEEKNLNHAIVVPFSILEWYLIELK
jgi:hypothetical protein